MNRNQKIFLIFGITSLTVFLISWYTFYPSLFTKTTGYRYTSLYETDTVTVHTNWAGMISLGTAIGSFLGVFLFKDK